MEFSLDESNLEFIESKGFDIKSLDAINKALEWMKTTHGDNLMYGDPTGEEFDIMMGELRRPMLIDSVEKEIRRKSMN